MCYTVRQKYKDCRVFRTHYVYRDIQCDEMKMWSKLFSKEVWCRATYQAGIDAITDEAQLASMKSGSHFPSPPVGIPVPSRLICRRCRGPQLKAKHARLAEKVRHADEKKPRGVGMMIKRQTLTMRRLWSNNVVPGTYELVSRVVPKAFVYNVLRICAKTKDWSK